MLHRNFRGIKIRNYTKFGQLIIRKIVNFCHQMSQLMAKMHQIRIPAKALSDPTGELTALPCSVVLFTGGPSSKRRK